jgi:hypothetical protein
MKVNIWPERAPSRQKRDRRGPCLPADRKGHNMNEISLARILLATACLGSPALWAGSFKCA